MEIYLLRHGVTAWNGEYKIQGKTDIPLNELGREMAKQTGERLKAQGVTFDEVYSSPLQRALETASLAVPDAGIITDDRLQELSFGQMEGETVLRMAETDLPFGYFKSDPVKYDELVSKDPGAETLKQLLSRAAGFMKEIVEGRTYPADARILISGHGAVDQAIINHIRGKKDISGFWEGGLLPNCGLDIIEYDEGSREYRILEEMVVLYGKELFEKAPALMK